MTPRALSAVLAAFLAAGCAASHERAPETVECENSADHYLWSADVPRPRGRIYACESAIEIEGAILSRQVALGCDLGVPWRAWTLNGACSYAEHVEALREIDAASTCAEIPTGDPCVRPDPRFYWREDGT